MSTRSFGMVGKTYNSASEAFKDANYATAIQRPQSSNMDGFNGFIMALLFVSIFAYGFWQTISHS
jgi:hypothetical protein